MNTYRCSFTLLCPNNRIEIQYDLQIQTREMIPVEEITAFHEGTTADFHETFADRLAARFPGRHTLRAYHHGVFITTTRGKV